MSGVLLVHGAWHGSWCFAKLLAPLQERRLDARAIDLPAHEPGGRPGWGVDLETYARAIAAEVARQPGKSHLVGHSMGGMVISRAAELAAERVASLTYLCAFLPLRGDSIVSLASLAPGSGVPGITRYDLWRGVATIRGADAARAVFYADCEDEDVAAAWSKLCPQSVRPLLDSVKVTDERFGRVPRYYIACTQDRAISIAHQRKMLERRPCRQVVTLETSHSPFLSAPSMVADAITGFVADAEAC